MCGQTNLAVAAATCSRRAFFANLGKCRINNTTWDVAIQVLSDTLLHNLWASDSFKAVFHLTPLSIFALALSIGSCKKKKIIQFLYQTASHKPVCQKLCSQNRYSLIPCPHKNNSAAKTLTSVLRQLQWQKTFLLPNLLPDSRSFCLEAEPKATSPNWTLSPSIQIVSLLAVLWEMLSKIKGKKKKSSLLTAKGFKYNKWRELLRPGWRKI